MNVCEMTRSMFTKAQPWKSPRTYSMAWVPLIGQFGLSFVNFIIGKCRAPIPVRAGPATQKDIHGDAADPRLLLAFDGHIGVVRRTFPDLEVLAAIRPHRTLPDGHGRIPVALLVSIKIEGAGDPCPCERFRHPWNFAGEEKLV